MSDQERGADWTTLLSGVVGSHAYGLATPASDVDILAVAAAPTRAFHGLEMPIDRVATVVRTDPDVTIHEARKMVALLLTVNPTVTELLWLTRYTVSSLDGAALVHIREAFLSAPRVRDAYLGYASQQFTRLHNEGRFPDVPRARIAKHARHLKRLLDQGIELWCTGELTVRVSNPEEYFTFGERVAADPLGEGGREAQSAITLAKKVFDTASTPLPAEPRRNIAVTWLHDVRRRFQDPYYHPGKE